MEPVRSKESGSVCQQNPTPKTSGCLIPPSSHGSSLPQPIILLSVTGTSHTHVFSPRKAPFLASPCASLTLTSTFFPFPLSTSPATKPADSDTVEATDRFGSVLTLRLVRRGGNHQGSCRSTAAFDATSGRPESRSDTTLAGTVTEAGKASAVTPGNDLAAGTRLRGREQTPVEPGTPCFHPGFRNSCRRSLVPSSRIVNS